MSRGWPCKNLYHPQISKSQNHKCCSPLQVNDGLINAERKPHLKNSLLDILNGMAEKALTEAGIKVIWWKGTSKEPGQNRDICNLLMQLSKLRLVSLIDTESDGIHLRMSSLASFTKVSLGIKKDN